MQRFPVTCPRCNGRVDVGLELFKPAQDPRYESTRTPEERLSGIFDLGSKALLKNEWRTTDETWQLTDPKEVLNAIVKNLGEISDCVTKQRLAENPIGDVIVLCQNLLDVQKIKHGEY